MRVDLFHRFHFCLQTPIQYWLNLLYVCGQNHMTTLQTPYLLYLMQVSKSKDEKQATKKISQTTSQMSVKYEISWWILQPENRLNL